MTIYVDQIKPRSIDASIVASRSLADKEIILELNGGVLTGRIVVGTGGGIGTHKYIGGQTAAETTVDNSNGGVLGTNVQVTLENINTTLLGVDSDILVDSDFATVGLMYADDGNGSYSLKGLSTQGEDLIGQSPDAYRLMLSSVDGYDPVTIQVETVGGEVGDGPTYEIIDGVVTEVTYTLNTEEYKPVEVALDSVNYLSIINDTDSQTISLNVNNLPTASVSTIRGKNIASTALVDSYILVYRDSTDEWELELKPASGTNPSMSDISDYVPSGLAIGDLIRYTGDGYTNAPLSTLETDPTVPAYVKTITEQQLLNWSAGYDHSISSHDYEASNVNIQNHIAIVSGNPHGLTNAILGAEPANVNIQAHISLVNEHIDWSVDQGGTLIHLNNIDIPTSTIDDNAIHVNEANEVSTLTEKTSLSNDDILILEDSASGFVKKYVKASNLPGAGAGISSAYTSITDGTNAVSADGSDTLKLRSGSLIDITIVDGDVIHGDNILFELSSNVATQTFVNDGFEPKNSNIQTHIGNLNNPHNTNKSHVGLSNVPNLDTTDAVSSAHSHSNKSLLDTYTQTEVDIASAIAAEHSHSNIVLLETYTQTEVDLASSVALKHTHANKTELDLISDGAHDIRTDNPHATTKTHIGLSLVPNLNTTDAVANEHTHSNKSLLDTYTQTEVDIADAISKEHTHSNKIALDTLTSDQIAGITNAVLPTASNPFVTNDEISDLGGGDMLKSVYDTGNNGKVDNADNADNANTVNGLTVETAVPVGASFTDTIYSHPANHAISFITGLQTELDNKVDDTQVLTNVPLGALFTDTVYTHPNYTETDVNTSAAQVIDTIAVTNGHISSVTTRDLTPADIGAQVSGNYDNYQGFDLYVSGLLKDRVASQEDVNFTNGGGLTIAYGSTPQQHTVIISHANSSSFSMSDLTGANVIMDINVDTYGHVTSVDTRALTLSNLGYTGDTNANYYTHPSYNSDDFSIDTGLLSGATVISDVDINVTTDSSGHVVDTNASIATRTLTLSNLGYTGDTNANNYIHPSYNSDDFSINKSFVANDVVSNISINVTTDSSGHVVDTNASVTSRLLTPTDIGASSLGHTHTMSNISNATESIQDIIGAMVSGNTETNISVTYDDTSGKLNFVATDNDTTYSAGEGISINSGVISHNVNYGTNYVNDWEGTDLLAFYDVSEDKTNRAFVATLADYVLQNRKNHVFNLDTNWTINASGTNLEFKYQGGIKMKLTSAGDLLMAGTATFKATL